MVPVPAVNQYGPMKRRSGCVFTAINNQSTTPLYIDCVNNYKFVAKKERNTANPNTLLFVLGWRLYAFEML